MALSVEDFRANPTLEALDRCTRDELKAIASAYKIPVDNKEAIKKNLIQGLVKQGVLPSQAADHGAEAAPPDDKLAINVEPHPVSDPSAANILLRIHEHEVEAQREKTRQKELEVEVQREQTRQKELEVEVQRLRFGALKLVRSPSSPKPKSDEAKA